ncbi:MAG: zinc-binding alcohol dehydrogenase [Eubacteriales bacterium]|nr:zinc-binding alcohol dehydrogenase [Eubacteriales bacterium]
MKRKQILFTGVGVAELCDTEIGKPSENEVLVKTEVSVISAGTERDNLLAAPNTAGAGRFPIAEGYCSVGIVEETGANVKKVKAGDRVLCYHGNHADYNKVPASQVYPVRDRAIPPEHAALVIIAAMGLGGVRKLRLEFGESAMVMGLGLLGMFSVQFLRLSGAMPLMVADLNEERRRIALATGAEYAFDPTDPDFSAKVKEITRGKGVKAIIEVTGKSIALKQALDCAAYMGRISLLGCTRTSDCPIDYYQKVHRPGVELIGAHNMVRPKLESYPYHWTNEDDCLAILDSISTGRLNCKPLINEIHSPLEASEVYAELATNKSFPLGVLFDWRLL